MTHNRSGTEETLGSGCWKFGKTGWFFPALLVITISCTLPSKAMADPFNVSVNPGMYPEELVPSIFYDHYIPIILEYKTPRLNKTEVTFNNWFNCTSDKYPYSLSCPVVFHLNTAVRNLHTDFESVQPGKDDEEHSHADHFNLLSTSKDFCHQIQKHFPGIYSNATDLHSYFLQLKNCSKDFRFDNNITSYRYDIRAPFSKMEFNFYSTFFQPVSNRSRDADVRLLNSAALSNSRTALQGSTIASFYAERNRWNFAVTHCFQNTLPPSLVTQDKLEEVLKDLEGASYNTSISNSSLSKYFSLPLTDCTYTETGFIVRLLVPMISSARDKYQLISAHPIRFQTENRVCSLKSATESTMYLYDVERQLAYKSSCKPNELCNINFHTEMDLCASAIFAKNITRILIFCEYKCEEPNQPFRLLRVSKNAYHITADSFTRIKISCQKLNVELPVTEEKQGPGNFVLTLFSKCEVHVSSDGASASMGSDLPIIGDAPYSLSQTIPLNFLRKERFLDENGASPTNFEMEKESWDFLDGDYMKSLLGRSANPESPMAQVQDVSTSSHTGLYLYIAFLSLLVAALVVCQYILLKRLSIVQGTSMMAGFHGESVNITSRESALLMEECEYAQ